MLSQRKLNVLALIHAFGSLSCLTLIMLGGVVFLHNEPENDIYCIEISALNFRAKGWPAFALVWDGCSSEASKTQLMSCLTVQFLTN